MKKDNSILISVVVITLILLLLLVVVIMLIVILVVLLRCRFLLLLLRQSDVFELVVLIIPLVIILLLFIVLLLLVIPLIFLHFLTFILLIHLGFHLLHLLRSSPVLYSIQPSERRTCLREESLGHCNEPDNHGSKNFVFCAYQINHLCVKSIVLDLESRHGLAVLFLILYLKLFN